MQLCGVFVAGARAPGYYLLRERTSVPTKSMSIRGSTRIDGIKPV
jgi:hypothetical protein